MRRSVALFTLLRIRFWTANEKKDIFGWSQSPSFNNLKKNVGALGTRMALSQSLSFPVPLDKGNAGSVNEIVFSAEWFVYDQQYHDY